MAKKITSRNPITRSARPRKVYNEVRLTELRAYIQDGQSRLVAKFTASLGSDTLPEDAKTSFSLNVDDFENDSPRLSRMWNRVSEVLALYYKQKHLEMEIERGIRQGLNVEGLKRLRDAAETEVQRPVA